jgi:ATP-binding protein involved in chromosome partitioning
MVIVTTPAQAAQKVAQRAADMAHRSFLPVIGVIENMSAFVCEHGESYALFGEGGGAALADAIDAPLLGQVPIEPAVAAGNDAGEPVALDGQGAAAVAFRDIATRLRDEVAPPAGPSDADMAGCSARMLDAVAAAFDD